MPFDDKGNWYPPGGWNTHSDMRAVKDYGLPPTPEAPPAPNFRMLDDQSLLQPLPKPKTFIDKVYNFLDNPISRGIDAFQEKGANMLTFGLMDKLNKSNEQAFAQKGITLPKVDYSGTAEKIGGGLGTFAGSVLPIGGAYKATAGLAGKLLPNVPKLVDRLGRGALAGTAYGLADQGIDATFDTHNNGDQTLGQRAWDVGKDALMFGAGDAALYGAGIGLKKVADSTGMTQWAKGLIERFRGPQQEFIPSTLPNKLGLPQPNNPIAGLLPQQKISGLLPEPPKPDFIAGFGQQIKPRQFTPKALESDLSFQRFAGDNPGQFRTVNPAERQLQELFNVAGQKGLSVGREYEDLQNLLGQLSDKSGMSLDDLINESTKQIRIVEQAVGKRVPMTPKSFMELATEVADRNRLAQAAGVMDRPTIGRGPTETVPFVQQNLLPPQLPKASGAPLQAANPFPANAIPIKPPALGKQTSNLQPLNSLPKQAPLKNNLLNPLQKQAAANISPMPEVAATRESALNAAADPELIHVSNVPKAKAEQVFKAQNVDPAQWKDKAKPFLVRETMERNFEDIMGKDAPAMKKQYLDPIKKGEADRIRFVNKERESVKTFDIKFSKKANSDDQLVQKYGEGLISEEELKQLTPNWQQVKTTAEAMRAKYDDLLTTVNQVLERNGYDPIPKRANYFPHYEEVDNFLSKAFGIKLEDFSLPTDINGLTADLKPGKNFFSNALKREGDKTDYGFIQGFDKYVEGVSKVIYHTDNIKRLRGLETALRDQFEGSTHLTNFVSNLREYTNILAGKKSMIDRGAEDIIGRKFYTFVDSVRKKVGANMIGGNIASAVTNFIPLTQSLATTDKVAFTKGMLDTMTNVFKNDGFINQSDFLTRRVGSDPLAMTKWDKTLDKAGWLFKTVDNFVSQTIVRGKYNEGLQKGLSPEQAMKQADDWAAKIMADRSAGSMPTLFDSRMLGLLTQFQLEVNNQLSFVFKDIPRNFNKVGAASAGAQLLIYNALFNELYDKMMGRKPALDPIGTIYDAYKDFNNPSLDPRDAKDKLYQRVLQQLPFSAVYSGGRIPVQAAIPKLGKLFSDQGNVYDDLVKPLMNVLPPVAGAQIMKTYEGVRNMGWSPLEPQAMPGVYGTDKKGEDYLKYPIEKNGPNVARSLLLGTSTLPETKQFYDNKRQPLSPAQTLKLEVHPFKDQAYNNLMVTRRLDTLEGKMDDIAKDKKLSKDEKISKIEELKRVYFEMKKQQIGR